MVSISPFGAAGHPALSTVDALAQLSFLIHGTLERLAAELGVSMAQTRLLGVLRDREPTMNELSQLLKLDKSSITGLVDRAERRGLVERIPSRIDRRAVLVRPTDEGRSLVAAVAGGFEGEVSSLLAGLAEPDRDLLSGLISRVLIDEASSRGIELF